MSLVVLTPAAEKRLTTVEHARADLGLSATVPQSQIERWIDQASARAASYCRRTFGREIVRERFALCLSSEQDGEPGLLLDRAPVVRILGVTLDSVAVAPETYETDGRSLFFLREGERRCWPGRVVAVDYESGWLLPGEARGTPPTTTAPDLPPDVEAAVIKLVGVAASAAGRDAMVKSEDVEGVGSRSWYVQGASSDLPHPEAESTLRDYRRLLFA